MPCPFPGMDPWLEAPQRWPGFHDMLVIKSVEILQPRLRPRGYYANPNERVWVSEADREIAPDVVIVRKRAHAALAGTTMLEFDEPIRVLRAPVEHHEGIVEIYDAETHQVVTCIEYLSPTNKARGTGRELYLRKRKELKSSGTSVVEVDFIRRGPHTVDIPRTIVEPARKWHYLINTLRSGAEDYEFYLINIRDRLPRIRIPLKAEDEDIALDLQDVFTRSYEISPYPDRLDYSQSPDPPLSDEDAAWARQILIEQGLL